MSTIIDTVPVAGRDHVVLFYGTDEELSERVGGHLAEAVSADANVIVIASPENCRGFEARMWACGVDVHAIEGEGRYRALDAGAVLERFLVDGRPDPGRFDEVIGELVRSAAATGRPVYAYGEMVALLWADGRVNAAIELESLWDDLCERAPLSLFCAYPSASLTGEGRAELVSQLCCLHSAVIGTPPPCRSARAFTTTTAAPRASRCFVMKAIDPLGLAESVTADAALLVTELATNAVLHARTDFTVGVVVSGSVLRIEVRDGGLARPTPHTQPHLSGRGLMLIDALASAWGTEHFADGKLVWAELRLGVPTAGNSLP